MIPVYEPSLGSEEEALVLDCIRSSWVSSAGHYLDEFESEFAEKCGTRYAIATSSGTTALHLILHALGIGPGDEVLVPSLTFVATANAVRYTGATPILVDSEIDTWNISVDDAARRITPRTKALIAVHLYGHPCKMPEILAFAQRHDLLVIEDAAEAHFARVGNKYVGTFGIAAAFSFYGNKIITTGEGGLVTTDDSDLAARMRYLRGHAMTATKRYWHDEVGFNYRMTNLQAAVGLAQLRKVDTILDRKAAIARWYSEILQGVPGVGLPPSLPGYHNVYWLFSILIDSQTFGMDRDALGCMLGNSGIDTRKFFFPVHTMPPYLSSDKRAIAERLSREGLSLPSGPKLNQDVIQSIAQLIQEIYEYVHS